MTVDSRPIIHLVHFYSSPGGIEVLSSRILEYLPSVDCWVFIIRPPAPDEIDVYEGTGVPISYGSKNNLKAVFRLWNYARKHSKDIFHVFNIGPFFLLSLRLAGATRIVYSIRGTNYYKSTFQKIVRKSLWGIAIKGNIRLISNSAYSRRVFLEKVNPRAEIQVVYNPVGGEKFFAKPERISPEILKIVYVGRLNEGKNMVRWIDLAYSIHREMNEVKFEIYGSGPLEGRLKRMLEDLEASSYITLHGFRRDIENAYREADLMLFLSEYESFGNAVVESILCGTPVIAADIPSMREIFADYPEFLIPADGDLQKEILSRLREYNLLLSKAKKASHNFRERFSLEAHVDTLNRIYRSFNG